MFAAEIADAAVWTSGTTRRALLAGTENQVRVTLEGGQPFRFVPLHGVSFEENLAADSQLALVWSFVDWLMAAEGAADRAAGQRPPRPSDGSSVTLGACAWGTSPTSEHSKREAARGRTGARARADAGVAVRTQLLARLGAEVVKIEHPGLGDIGRGSLPGDAATRTAGRSGPRSCATTSTSAASAST